MKRRWDDDVVFKNQARGTEDKNKKKEFVNVSFACSPMFFCRIYKCTNLCFQDMLRSDFHRRFMSKYVR